MGVDLVSKFVECINRGDEVAVVGHTTGSHLGLSDEDEQKLTVIWFARVDDGRLACWRLNEDNAMRRQEFGLVG